MKIRRLACLARLTLIATALVIAPAFAESAAPPLGAYNADINESSISGISSGAFMAVQFGVAWSSIVKGLRACPRNIFGLSMTLLPKERSARAQ